MGKKMGVPSNPKDFQARPTDWELISTILDMRAERVKVLKKLVEQGDYIVDPRKAANAILVRMLQEHGII